jgi:hypothetical protein
VPSFREPDIPGPDLDCCDGAVSRNASGRLRSLGLLFHLSSFEKAFVNLVNLRTEVLESTHLSHCCRMIGRLFASGCRTRFRGIRSKLTVPKGNEP